MSNANSSSNRPRFNLAPVGGGQSVRTSEGDPECPLCHGSGGRYVETGCAEMGPNYTTTSWNRCRCVAHRYYRETLEKVAPDLAPIEVIDSSPEIVQLLSGSYWITAPWDEFAPHLRAATFARHTMNTGWRFRLYRDTALKALVFADQTARSFDDTGVERLDEGANLIIIRTGFLTKANDATQGLIDQLISERINLTTRSVWIVDDTARPLTARSPFWSPGVDQLSTRHLRPFDV